MTITCHNARESLAKIKTDLATLQTLRSTEQAQDAIDVMARMTITKDQLFDQIHPFEKASDIMGHDYFGPEHIERTFGVKLPRHELPMVPFSLSELKHAKELGQMLILRADATNDGRPLSLEAIAEHVAERDRQDDRGAALSNAQGWRDVMMGAKYYSTEAPRAGWALVSKMPVPGTFGKKYIGQTESLIQYIVENVYMKQELPREYIEAIQEFKGEKKSLVELQNEGNWREATKQLAQLKITKLSRQTVVEAVYDLLSRYEVTGEQLLEDAYTWTSSPASSGTMAYVGRFGTNGIGGGAWNPNFRRDDTGALFSRRS